MLLLVSFIFFNINFILINSRNYLYVDQFELNFQDAKQYCRTTIGTDLATILTQQDYISALNTIPIDQDKVWIGLHDTDSNNDYTWSDGTVCAVSGGQCTSFWSSNIDFGRCVVLHTNNTATFERNGFMAIECTILYNNFLCNDDGDDNTITPQLTTITNTQLPTLSPSETPTLHIYSMNEDYIYITETKMSFNDAQNFCRNKVGTSLATILSEEDIESAISLIRSESNDVSAWIGLYTSEDIGWWLWIDGTQCIKSVYGTCSNAHFWRDGQPKCLKQNENGYNCTNLGIDNKFDNDIDCHRSKTFLCNALNKENSNNKALIDMVFDDKYNDKNSNNNYHGLDKYTIFRISVLCFILVIILLILCFVSSKKLILFFRKRYEEKYETVKCIEYCDNTDDDTSDELDEILADSM